MIKPVIIEYASELYPKRLREIENPPSRLYGYGNVEILGKIGIAVVGSRTNTLYGEKMCKNFVKNLVEYNFNIISGLAFGIDSIAHKTCLENCGSTIGVLPSGLDNICNATNKMLIEKIVKNGGIVISEYENDVKADSRKFLERNRIVAGLGMGTLVVEAGHRSGTSVTARFTEKYGKPVFCIPSNLDNKKGKTTNELIKKGSKLVVDVEDIVDEIKKNNPNIVLSKKIINEKNFYFDVSPELIKIYKEITDIPKDINQIARNTGLPVSEVNYKTMMLQLEDKIFELPGQGFVLNKS